MGALYVIRHGQTSENAAGIVQGPRIDGELSEEGRRQAQRLAEALSALEVEDLVVSPMQRARQTAAAISARIGADVPVTVEPEYYELDYGDLIGHPMAEVGADMEQVFDAWAMGFPDEPFPGGESAVLAQHRIRPTVQHVLAVARDHDVALVGHGRINRVLVATLTGAGLTKMEEIPQDNANITELSVDGDGVRVVRLNDVRHLEGP